MTARWHSGEYIGDTKPMARVTVHHPNVKLVRTPENLFATLPFGGGSVPKELPNVRSVEWNRDTDSDVASATIAFYNTDPLPLGEAPTAPSAGELDRPGWYTYNRGSTAYSRRWGHEPNEWANMLMPDNVLRTFEGYGFDGGYIPEKDPNLVQTGVWLIDDVEITTDGYIVCKCRDLGRLLLDQISFPPVTPFKSGFVTKDMPDGAYAYPVTFTGVNSDPIFNKVANPPSRLPLKYHSNSNIPWTGRHSSVYGHSPQDAFDGDSSSWWLSIGNARPDQGYSFEWIQGSMKKQRLRRVRFRTRGSGYTCYLSVYVEGKGWQGNQMIPYDPNHPASAPNGADIRFVSAQGVASESWHEFNLGDGYANVTRVRLTFGGLWYSGAGTYKYRAGVRRFEVHGGSRTTTEKTTFEDKNYDDYTDIVKLFCAWGGLYWPRDGTREGIVLSDGTQDSWPFKNNDRAMTIKYGRVWGDFQQSGTAGPAPISADTFDKKPLMDGIAYVRDILGFIFHVDEYGGAVFKAPNIFAVGNTLRSLGQRSGERTTRMISLDERQVLIEAGVTLTSRNIRERTFVSTTNGLIGHIAKGWNPNSIGLRRVGGWTDQNFSTDEECQVMAEMIALRQLFTYRTDSVTIPGYPAIQIDDQVRIFERVSNEGYIHYVKGIQSRLDLESGEYSYTLDTHWLGERPFKKWAFDPERLSRETRRYLEGLYG